MCVVYKYICLLANENLLISKHTTKSVFLQKIEGFVWENGKFRFNFGVIKSLIQIK
jgi:hypothetical protein